MRKVIIIHNLFTAFTKVRQKGVVSLLELLELKVCERIRGIEGKSKSVTMLKM
jgi:hypothetical protein